MGVVSLPFNCVATDMGFNGTAPSFFFSLQQCADVFICTSVSGVCVRLCLYVCTYRCVYVCSDVSLGPWFDPCSVFFPSFFLCLCVFSLTPIATPALIKDNYPFFFAWFRYARQKNATQSQLLWCVFGRAQYC
jgi:hypothetical protein